MLWASGPEIKVILSYLILSYLILSYLISELVLAVHFVPFLVDRHIDGSSKFRRPRSFSNDLIAQAWQLCHHLTAIIDSLDKLCVKIVRPGCVVVVDMSDRWCAFCW